jgi:hypothetical protein
MRDFNKVEYYELTYRDFEKLVREVYGPEAGRYEFVADMECGNDSQHSFTTESYHGVNSPDFSKSYITADIIAHLASIGEIPEGEYLITVCW